MIWIYDSGLWGLMSLKYFQQSLPHHDFLYLGDTKYLPYGEKTGDFLLHRSFDCLKWMFSQWCELVIMACNSASTYAIRQRQTQYPDRKVLSITIPWVETIVQSNLQKTMLLATQATIDGNIYPKVMQRLFPEHTHEFVWVAWTWLVQLIEYNAPEHKIVELLEKIILPLDPDLDSLVLGCTHYPLIQWLITQLVSEDIQIIDPSLQASQYITDYLGRHPELNISKSTSPSTKKYLTSLDAVWGHSWYTSDMLVADI